MENKVVVIGLDGATFDIIDPLIKQGKLPNLSKIFDNGVKARLFSSIPPVSAPAWISFLTGKNPGKHGILGFQYYNMSKYNCFEHGIVTSKHFANDTILDTLTKNDKRSIAFQIPLTYPAWPINGLMVSGYPTPDQTKAYTYPEELSEDIGKLYEYKSDQIASGSPEEKVDIYSKGVDRVSQKVEKLLKTENYDLFIYVNNITDWVQHKFWKYQFNNEQNINYIDYFYIKLDEKIGNILNIIDENTTLFIMSDHGAGKRPTKFLNINYILRKNHLLTAKKNKISIFTRTTKYWLEWIK
ncbi:MAG: alkaline phosphatase family protein, partial [Vampirovibrionia bacterium]